VASDESTDDGLHCFDPTRPVQSVYTSLSLAPAETIGSKLGAGPRDMILGEAFTKLRVMSPDVGRSRIVLLATHALLPTNLKCQPGPSIVVSVPANSRNAEAGFLRPRTSRSSSSMPSWSYSPPATPQVPMRRSAKAYLGLPAPSFVLAPMGFWSPIGQSRPAQRFR
jgi:hypothetical protein